MKNFLRVAALAICAIFMVANASAQVITAERASEIANQFFANGKQKSAAFRSKNATLTQSIDSRAVTGESNEAPTFHILTGADGKGFVIVSGEETENPIIGYSFDGTIDTNNLPDGFVGYMSDIDAQVRALRKYNAANPQKAAARSAMQKAADFEYNATTMGNIVKNLNTAPWGQRTPFNNLCKTTDGQTALTGCGPTAFAILCYYYKWPASGVGTVTHQGTGENMELGHTYDYASMRNDDYRSGYTEAEANAVAVLMRDLGWANQVGYGTGSTSFSETGQHMVDHFRFKSERPVDHGASLAVVRSTLGNDTQWKTYIKNCLNAGYPIPYASTTNTSNSARHIYILDGYTDNDYYHFNWGWSGQGNGWFTLDNMVPDDYSNYSNSHKAYFNLIPDATTYTVTATATPSNMGTVSINGGTAGSTVTADLLQGVTATLTAHPADGYALASWTKGGVIVGTRNTLQVPVGTSGNDYVANFADASTVTVIQDYTINATSGTKLTTGDKVQEWVFNRNNDYPAELKLTSTDKSINTNNAGDCIQLYLVDKTSETFTLSVPEDYVITKYTIRCKTSSTYITSIAAEGQTYTPTKNYADYTFTKNAQARGAANSSELTIVGSANRALMVETITVTVAKEGANVPSTPTTYTINVNAETGGNAYVNGTNTSATVDAGTDVTLQAYPDGTNYTFAGWYNGNSWVSSNNPYTFALNSNVTYTAKFNAVATTYAVTTTANPAAGGTAKFAVGTGSQKTQGDVESGTQITLYAVANTGYNFVNWTLGGNVVSTDATCNVSVSQAANYVANFEAIQQPGDGEFPLAGKWFRLKEKSTGTYMNIYDNNTHGKETRGGVNVTTLNKNNDGQIFQFIESGTNYKLQSKTGYYITWAEWNVNADSDTNGAELIFESTANNLEYLISCTKGYFKIDDDKGTPSLGKFVYCDAARGAAATWVLEEVVYYTVTATAGEGGSVSPLTSTIEKGKSITLTATANEGYRFVNWTLNGNVVSTDASYTFNATAAGEYVANFEISTYTISATTNPGTAGSVTINGEAVSSKNVNENSTVTLVATPQAGYYFVNWTNGTDVVSTDATYTFTATADTNLKANFEKKVINVTLTDNTNSNNQNPYVFEFVLDDLEGEVTTAAIANKLMEKYPVIKSVGEGNNATLTDNGTSYTYTNTVKLPFEVANGKEDDAVIWYNIYYPSNNKTHSGYPNYIAALNEDEIVDMAASPNYAYGDNPDYNTLDGNENISWAIYNVDNSFKFIFKSKSNGNYIKVESVVNATGNTQNVKFVENAEEATAFTLLKDTGTYNGDYALVANVGDATGYLCATSSDENYVTHFDRNNHQGAWVKFVESPDYNTPIWNMSIVLSTLFSAGNDKYVIVNTEIEEINNAMQNSGSITWNKLQEYAATMDNVTSGKAGWIGVSVAVAEEQSDRGAAVIQIENDNPNLTSKKVPNGYELTIKATPNEGYHFTKWTKGTEDVSEANPYTFKATAAGTTTANFAINIYSISVTAGEGGSANASATTVEHGGEVTLTAVANDGYEFVNWTKGTEVVSTNATYTFPVTADGEYVANFELSNTPVKYYTVRIETEGLSNDKFAAYINTGTTQNETAKDYEPGSTVRLIAIQDNSNVGSYGYAFVGWYLNGTLVDIDEEIEFNITSNVTYTAKFVEGIRISTRAERGWPHIYLYESDKEVGGTSMSTILVPGRRLKLSVTPEYGCSFTHWTVGDEVVSTDNPFITEPLNEAVTFKAICEPAYYNLTVRSNPATAGKVTVNSNESSSEMTVKVGHNTDATITATPNDGFTFVNWTKGTDVVSTNATYTIAAIDAIEDLKDVEYIANFIEVETAEPGVYYRFAYEFPAAAAASAARAAGDVVTYVVSTSTGSFSSDTIWTSTLNNNPAGLKMLATTNDNGKTIASIIPYSTNQYHNFSLKAGGTLGSTDYYSTTYTLSVAPGFKIIGYEMTYYPSTDGKVTLTTDFGYTKTPESSSNDYVVRSSDYEFTESEETKFVVSTSAGKLGYSIRIVNFEVYIQEVGSGEGEGGEGEGGEGEGGETPETPETPVTPSTEKYYIQSVACGVSGGNNLQNALEMTKDTTATSIFYYADNKLLSYDKGLYIIENGGTRGLQAVGVSGTVTITTSGETATISAPNYMHANTNGTTYYADHCGSNTGTAAHANHNFVLEEVTTLPVTISSALHATFYAPVAVAIPDGVKAYVLKAENIPGIETYAWMTSLKNGIIPANTGVIIKGAEGTYYFDIVDNSVENYDAARAEAVGNVLDGTVAKTKITEDAYILANREGKVGLYPVAKNSYLDTNTIATTVRFTNNSHKAYLPVKNDWFGEQLKMGTGFRFVYDDEETTEIEEIEREVKDTIYDLQGRKLSEITEPGIYIVNGKKVWVK